MAAVRIGTALLAAAAAVAATAARAEAQDARLKDFFGTYVGVAEVRDPPTGEVAERDIDIAIRPYERDGFHIEWVNVTKVDGRRDVPGVERNVEEVRFKPAGDGADFYVEVPPTSPFREREETRPMRGDPVRWAAIEGDSLYVYSFVVLDDGRYELQVYERKLTDEGIDLAFQRLVDGEVLREIVGRTVRAEEEQGEEEGGTPAVR